MAWDAFLTIDGVEGESQRTGHEGQIEITSFQFGASNPSSVGHGSGGGTGTVSISSFNITKRTDATSPALFQKCCEGEHYPTAKLTLYKSGGSGGALDYLTYEFEEVYVDNISWSGAEGGDPIPFESVSFSFGKVTVNYATQNADGTKAGVTPGSWDVRTRTP
jgi:type VI secretion system secreted protein Hcp